MKYIDKLGDNSWLEPEYLPEGCKYMDMPDESRYVLAPVFLRSFVLAYYRTAEDMADKGIIKPGTPGSEVFNAASHAYSFRKPYSNEVKLHLCNSQKAVHEGTHTFLEYYPAVRVKKNGKRDFVNCLTKKDAEKYLKRFDVITADHSSNGEEVFSAIKALQDSLQARGMRWWP